jgi:hypothetical protein
MATSEKHVNMPVKMLFITGRFRSGSTLLWNIFHNIENCCAYYEPCHDLLLTHIKHNSLPPPSHIGVSSYWDEYLPILDDLELFHRIDFGVNRLFLEEGSKFEDLGRYIHFLISSTNTKLPVLQFNRMDFRLPWLREQFPEAKILHLFRNPRDQWFSMVRDLPREGWTDPFLNTNYELMTWSCSLGCVFPFLFGSHIKSSYHRHYLLWRLSKLMGEHLSDLSIDFDQEILVEPAKTIKRMITFAGIEKVDIDELVSLVVKPETGGWQQFEAAEWFDSAERECDALLERLGLIQNFGRMPLTSIIKINRRDWKQFGEEAGRKPMEEALKLFAICRKEDLKVRNELKVGTEHFQEQLKKIDRFNFLKRILLR